VSPGEIIDCESGRYPVGRHTIKDVHPYSLLTFRDVIIRSSNIGMTKIGMRLGKERLYSYLREFGFGQPSNLGLPGETSGIFRGVDSWATVDIATHSFGQGIAVTPLQMARAYAALVNGGSLPVLHVIDNGELPKRQVISTANAAKVRDMLVGVVEDEHGTGKNAAIKGVQIGGKTGTAQKARANGRGYQAGAYVASFIGFANSADLDLQEPLVLMVMIDEPRTNSIYGGTLAAPVFRKIMQRSLEHLMASKELNPAIRPPRPLQARNRGYTEVTYKF
jgi:cell division protein FtsI (penicillin-binding protein 3)